MGKIMKTVAILKLQINNFYSGLDVALRNKMIISWCKYLVQNMYSKEHSPINGSLLRDGHMPVVL